MRLTLALFVAVLLGLTPVAATTVIPPTFDQLVDNAREIFVGRVVARESRWVTTRDGPVIMTLVTFRIDDPVKGQLGTQTSLEFLGGTVGEYTMSVAEMPQFNIGDRDMLFVGNRNAASPLVGFMYGRFRIAYDARGIETIQTYDGLALTSGPTAGPTQTSPRVGPTALSQFREAVLERLRRGSGPIR